MCLTVLRSAGACFAREPLEQAADLALLLGLRVDPVADHLLLGAHVVTRPWIASARLAIAVVAALLEPPSVDAPPAAARSRSASRRRWPAAIGAVPRARRRGRARWWRASLRARCRSGSAPGSSAGRGSRAPASRRGRTARTRTRCPCRRAARRALRCSVIEHRAGVAADLEPLDHACRPSRPSRSGPRTCRAGRGRQAGRSCSARCRAPRRGGWRSSRGCRA